MNWKFLVQYFDKTKSHGRTILGQSDFTHQGISHGDQMFLDYVVSRNDFRHFIELGTYGGYTSLYLGLMAKLRSGLLTTYDIEDLRPMNVKRAWLDNMIFMQSDILSEPNKGLLVSVNQPKTFVFIDNGNKVKEVEMYASRLAIGSGFVVHDWDIEISRKDIESVLEQGFVEYYEDIAENFMSTCRFFRKESK